jgi:transcription elongation GreA/GreB family factor
VAFGARVRFLSKGRERTVDIVGSDEADPAQGRIAFTAPLARALIGAGVGDTADFNGDSDAIEILEIGLPDSDER